MKRNFIAILFFILLVQQSFAQELLNDFKVPSKEHVQIKGTNVFMIPPTNFVESDRFKGFQNPDDKFSMIMVAEMPAPFSEFSKGFSDGEGDEKMAEQGMKIINKSKIKVNNYEGLLIELEQEVYETLTYSKSILIYGDKNFTMMINGVFIKDSVEVGKSIKNCVLSTVVDDKIKVNPRETLDYQLDESKGNLIFNGVMGTGMLFNRDGEIPTKSPDGISVITAKAFAKVEIKDKKKFCNTVLKMYPEKVEVIGKGIQEIELGGLKGYSLFAKSLETKNDEMYHVMLFEEGGGYYRLIGTYNKKTKKAKTDVIKVINSFKLKKSKGSK